VLTAACSQERRQALHQAAVEAIEHVYADRIAEQVERLAHHAVSGRVLPKAMRYLREAGSRAVGRSANREAVAYFSRHSRWLGECRKRRRHYTRNLDSNGFGTALIAVKVRKSTESRSAIPRALWLVEHLKAEYEPFPVQWGLWYVSFTRAQHLWL
jgi:hypothetical protein